MKAFALFFLVSLNMSLAYGQEYPIFTDQLVGPSDRQPRKSFIMYEVGEIQLFNSDAKKGKYFYILDEKTGYMIFEYDQREIKARRFSPRFFKSVDNDELIILVVSLEGDYSLGCHIFIIENGKVSHPGFLPYGVDNLNFSSLGLHGQFEKHNDWFIMYFDDETQLIDYETDDLILGKDIEFKVEKDRITRIK